jgi:hypothetical protein
VDLAHVDGLYDCLATLPAGDKRSTFCFVRPGMTERFLDIIRTELADVCECFGFEQLMRSGAFGPGAEHPKLRGRVGDYILIATADHAVESTVFGRKPNTLLANHGGLLDAETLVPLYAVDC